MTQTVAAMSIQRRTAAIAIFRDLHLEGVVVRHVPSDITRAENTIMGFAHEMCSHYKISAVAVETTERKTTRLERSYDCARKAFEEESVSLHEVPLRELMESFAYQLLKAILAALKLISVPAAEIARRECLIEGRDHNEYNYIPLNSDDIPSVVSDTFLSSSC